jgi:hypothetical protein
MVVACAIGTGSLALGCSIMKLRSVSVFACVALCAGVVSASALPPGSPGTPTPTPYPQVTVPPSPSGQGMNGTPPLLPPIQLPAPPTTEPVPAPERQDTPPTPVKPKPPGG